LGSTKVGVTVHESSSLGLRAAEVSRKREDHIGLVFPFLKIARGISSHSLGGPELEEEGAVIGCRDSWGRGRGRAKLLFGNGGFTAPHVKACSSLVTIITQKKNICNFQSVREHAVSPLH
jgi:hypothetical protein